MCIRDSINGARLSGSSGTFMLIFDIFKSIFTGTVDSFKAVFSPAA